MLSYSDYESKKRELKEVKKKLRSLRLFKNAPYYFMLASTISLTPTAMEHRSEPKYAYYEADVLNDGTIDISEEKKYKRDINVDDSNYITKREVVYDEIEENYKEREYEYEIPNLTFSNIDEITDNIDNILDYFDYEADIHDTDKTKESTEYSGTLFIKDPKDFKESNKKNEFIKYLAGMTLFTFGLGYFWKLVYFREFVPKYKETKEKAKQLKLELKDNEEEYKRY